MQSSMQRVFRQSIEQWMRGRGVFKQRIEQWIGGGRQPVAFVWLLLFFCMLIVGSQSHLFAGLAAPFRRDARRAAYTISGTVFNDYHQNGTQDSREPGVNGVTVKAYDMHGKEVASATSATLDGKAGQYALSIGEDIGPVRVQFSGIGAQAPATSVLSQFYPGKHGSDDTGSMVAFVDGSQGSYTINQGIAIPSDYCQENPNLVTSCYVRGDNVSGKNAANHVVVRWPYQAAGTTPSPVGLALASSVGTTWGLAYRRSTDSLFAGTYIKRFAGLGSSGNPGTIYLIQGASGDAPTASSFVTLDAGTNPHDASNYRVDGSAYKAVGKVGIGGLDISGDDATLYAVNLFDKKLYSIPLGAPPAAPLAGTPQAIAMPALPNCAAEDARPFAVRWHQGTVYVGEVCSAESSQEISQVQGYVLAYTPEHGFDAAPVFSFSLGDYARGCTSWAVDDANAPCLSQATWQPWSEKFPTQPQPMLSSIAFDNGDLILGLRDRFGDMGGRYAPPPDGGPTLNTAFPAGDTLRACLKTPGEPGSGWSMESNGKCGSQTSAGGVDNNQGPDGGKFYFEDTYKQPTDQRTIHDKVLLGGVAQIPGFTSVASTVYNPLNSIDTAGVRTWTDSDGTLAHSYQVYGPGHGNFGKAAGLGDLIALCQAAPIEIGHRVWVDTNHNGLQDAGEPGLAGVTVRLYDDQGTQVATTITDAKGDYYFSIAPYKTYNIKLDNAADYVDGGALASYQLTEADQDPQKQIDSKATLSNASVPIGQGNFPQITVKAHRPGENDYTMDIGFMQKPAITPTPSPAVTPTAVLATPSPTVTPTAIPVTATPTMTPTAIPVTPALTVTSTPVPATPAPAVCRRIDPPESPMNRWGPTLEAGTSGGEHSDFRCTVTPIAIAATPAATRVPIRQIETPTTTPAPLPPRIALHILTPTDVPPALPETPTPTPGTPTDPPPMVTPLPMATFWLQQLDSCRQGLGGAVFQVTGKDFDFQVWPTAGNKPKTVQSGGPCPIQQGNCVKVASGCLPIMLPVPVAGTVLYSVKEVVAPDGYVLCLGGNHCPGAHPLITVKVASNARMSAITREIYADNHVEVFPTNRAAFSGTDKDPALVYNGQIEKGNKGNKGNKGQKKGASRQPRGHGGRGQAREVHGIGEVVRNALTRVALAAVSARPIVEARALGDLGGTQIAEVIARAALAAYTDIKSG